MNISATELPNFTRKYYLLHELLLSEYWRQNISVCNIALHTAVRHSGLTAAHRARDSASVNSRNTTPSLQLCGQPTVLTLTQSTTRFGGSCRIVCTAARFVTSTSWSLAWSTTGNISGGHRWSGQAVASTSWSLRSTSSTRLTFWTQTLECAEVLPFARTHTWQSITCVPIVDTYPSEWTY